MSAVHHSPPAAVRGPPGYRRVLWIALGINASMFIVEGGAGLAAGSVALQADALDFLGDAATYALTLFVLGMALRWRARAALLKGASMGLFGFWVIGNSIYHLIVPGVPTAEIMTSVGVLALAANLTSALLLYRHRHGDANMRSVWLCTRNDALGNIAVILAGVAVFASASNWPDLAVGVVMAGLALSSARQVLRQAQRELRPAT